MATFDGCADRVNLNAVLFVEMLASALLKARATNAAALANLGNGLLDRNTRRSAHNLLALELVVLVLPAIQTAAHQGECALDATDKSAEAKDNRCALDYKRTMLVHAIQFATGVSNDIQGKPRTPPAMKPPKAAAQGSSFSRKFIIVREKNV